MKFAADVFITSFMHFEHDKHQYFYEKYLRNEMQENEKTAFEERLQNDIDLKRSFDFYVKNREEILNDELNDDDETIIGTPKKPEKWGWLYLGLSILGLVLVIDYFANINYQKNLDNKYRKTLIDRINIFKQESNVQNINKTEIKNIQKQENKKSKKPVFYNSDNEIIEIDSSDFILNELDEKLNSIKEQNKNLTLETDVMLFDSIFICFDEKRFIERLNNIYQNTDSVLTDSIITILTLKSLLRNPDKNDVLLFTEFWQSPVNFKGYRFSGKKIQLYGISVQFPFYFVKNSFSNEYFLINGNRRFKLKKDNNFHKFTTNDND
ncbi:MAG: hypothetical protein ACK4K9_11610 [Bacteroidia bacterium]